MSSCVGCFVIFSPLSDRIPSQTVLKHRIGHCPKGRRRQLILPRNPDTTARHALSLLFGIASAFLQACFRKKPDSPKPGYVWSAFLSGGVASTTT
jgi:hypothetical protein